MITKKTKWLWFVILLNPFFASSQVNGYARVSNVAGASLTVTNINETFDSFEVGEQVVILQVQDNVIGDVTNSATFGSLGSILSAGLYEIRVIASITESGGIPTTIVLSNAPVNTYNTGSNSSVQLITFPTLNSGGGNYTTTGNIPAVAWNGNVGGVVAFNVNGILTLAHNITANGSGFRGGAANGGASAGCTPTGNYSVVSQDNFADKGEGIYRSTTASYAAGRGKILNAGGGGNSHNAGGGGGGNYTAGGEGGPGWICSPSAGGIAGISLSSNISASRVFMGGGGGGGEGNNGVSTAGGNGGGIVLINATELRTTGTCGGRTISANANNAANSPSNDGCGGGGGGGSVVIQVATYTIVAGCPLTVQASGGNGGSVNTGDQHGGGGGGGQGVVIYSSSRPTTNVTTTTNNGTGGCNNNSNPCTNQAPSGSGTAGSGIIELSPGPLPVKLLDFTAFLKDDEVELQWITESEVNNEAFYIERSRDAEKWLQINRVTGSGNSNRKHTYHSVDQKPFNGFNYYRLKQVDYNGAYEYSFIVSAYVKPSGPEINIFPNPASSSFNVELHYPDLYSGSCTIQLSDVLGRVWLKDNVMLTDHRFSKEFHLSFLPTGVYQVDFQGVNFNVSNTIIIH